MNNERKRIFESTCLVFKNLEDEYKIIPNVPKNPNVIITGDKIPAFSIFGG